MSAPDDMVTRLRAVAWLAEEGSEVVDLAATAADEIERLRAVLDAIDALHQPYPLGDGRTSEDCDECGDRWPCPTYLLIHAMTLDEAIDVLGTVHK